MLFYAKRAHRIRIVFGLKVKCVSKANHFAVGRTELRVYVLREERRAMPAYEEPPVLPGGSFLYILLNFNRHIDIIKPRGYSICVINLLLYTF